MENLEISPEEYTRPITITRFDDFKSLDIKTEKSYEEVNIFWRDKSISVICCSNTFNNCQVFTIGSFDNLIVSLSSPYSDLTMDELKQFIRNLKEKCNDKRFVCINVLKQYENTVTDIFGESSIVIKQEYENRPTIFMHLYLIDLDKSLYTPRNE